MDVARLKNTILEMNAVRPILEKIGCGNIRLHQGAEDDYYTCSNKDGNNPSAITVYLTPTLKTINYTRELNPKKQDHDIIDLIMFNEKISFFMALKLMCDVANINYYGMENDDDLPESIKLTQYILSICGSSDDEYEEDKNEKIEEKPEYIINRYYTPSVHDMFADDGISYQTQVEFEIGYDSETDSITIPIRDELGNLVGIKARRKQNNLRKNKYVYLIGCPRGKILYNLYRAYNNIQEEGFVIVVESEKAVMQLYDIGVYNVIALSGSKLTSNQKQKLIDLRVEIVFALDKDISRERLVEIGNRFPSGISVYAVYDKDNLLDEKQSPTDDITKWEKLISEYVIKLHE